MNQKENIKFLSPAETCFSDQTCFLPLGYFSVPKIYPCCLVRKKIECHKTKGLKWRDYQRKGSVNVTLIWSTPVGKHTYFIQSVLKQLKADNSNSISTIMQTILCHGKKIRDEKKDEE